MGAQLRVYRRRIRSVQSTRKITRAQELIAASRIARAQQRVTAAAPYAEAITRAVAAVTAQGGGDGHPLLSSAEQPRRAAMLLITSDRGLAGAYSANAIKAGEQLTATLRGDGLEVLPYLSGRKGIGYYRFRQREVTQTWSGFSEQPRYENAREVADALVEAYLTPTEEGGVDEIHVVFTESVSALSQRATARRILPLDLDDAGAEERPTGAQALYEFEPSAEGVLDALLPRYVQSQVYAAFLQSALSESSSRRRAMKSASDNAEDLVRTLTRLANQARQAEITQEISEIVGGADALAAAGSDAR